MVILIVVMALSTCVLCDYDMHVGESVVTTTTYDVIHNGSMRIVTAI